MRVEQRAGILVVTPSDDVDIATAESVKDTVLDGVSNWSGGAVLDLTQARYLDSAGVRIILTLAQRLRHRRQQLRLVATSGGAVDRVLEIAGISGVVPVDDSAAAAVRAIRPVAAHD